MQAGTRRRTDAPGARRVAWRALPCAAVVILVAAITAFAALPQDEDPDDLIYDRVIRKLANDHRLKTNALEVSVEDAVVTVEGTVKNEKLRQRVEKVIKQVKGVKEVNNKVRVRR